MCHINTHAHTRTNDNICDVCCLFSHCHHMHIHAACAPPLSRCIYVYQPIHKYSFGVLGFWGLGFRGNLVFWVDNERRGGTVQVRQPATALQGAATCAAAAAAAAAAAIAPLPAACMAGEPCTTTRPHPASLAAVTNMPPRVLHSHVLIATCARIKRACQLPTTPRSQSVGVSGFGCGVWGL